MKIRVASKNFICEKCNLMINKNEKYFDWWGTIKGDVDYYYHKRYHLGCINNEIVSNMNGSVNSNTNNVSNKPTIFDRVQKLLEQENGCLIASNNGIKCYVCGIGYNQNDEKGFLCMSWEDKKQFFETADNMKKYIDCYGNYL